MHTYPFIAIQVELLHVLKQALVRGEDMLHDFKTLLQTPLLFNGGFACIGFGRQLCLVQCLVQSHLFGPGAV